MTEVKTIEEKEERDGELKLPEDQMIAIKSIYDELSKEPPFDIYSGLYKFEKAGKFPVWYCESSSHAIATLIDGEIVECKIKNPDRDKYIQHFLSQIDSTEDQKPFLEEAYGAFLKQKMNHVVVRDTKTGFYISITEDQFPAGPSGIQVFRTLEEFNLKQVRVIPIKNFQSSAQELARVSKYKALGILN